MKGFNLSSWIDAGTAINYCEQIENLGSDLIRYQMIPEGSENQIQAILTNRSSYKLWLAYAIDRLCFVANAHARAGGKLRFIADIHAVTGGIIEHGGKLVNKALYDATTYSNWIEDFTTLAAKTSAIENIFALEPINEPKAKTWKDWSSIVKSTAPTLAKITAKKVVISCNGIGPESMAYMPRLRPQRFIATCHFWPPHITLVGINGVTRQEKHIAAVKRDSFLHSIKDAIGYKQRFGVPVLVGEIGCTRGIGDETQKMAIRKTLNHCLANGLSVCVHTFDNDPAWGYRDSGVLDAIRRIYRA